MYIYTPVYIFNYAFKIRYIIFTYLSQYIIFCQILSNVSKFQIVHIFYLIYFIRYSLHYYQLGNTMHLKIKYILKFVQISFILLSAQSNLYSVWIILVHYSPSIQIQIRLGYYILNVRVRAKLPTEMKQISTDILYEYTSCDIISLN